MTQSPSRGPSSPILFTVVVSECVRVGDGRFRDHRE